MSCGTNITVQDVFELDIGIGPHYYVVIMEDTPQADGKVLALYLRTYDDPLRQDDTTILLKGEHDWLTERMSWVCYANPLKATKQYILTKAVRIAQKPMRLEIFQRIMGDFVTVRSDNLSMDTVKKYFELREERTYYCLFQECADLEYFPPRTAR